MSKGNKRITKQVDKRIGITSFHFAGQEIALCERTKYKQGHGLFYFRLQKATVLPEYKDKDYNAFQYVSHALPTDKLSEYYFDTKSKVLEMFITKEYINKCYIVNMLSGIVREIEENEYTVILNNIDKQVDQ